MLSTFRFSVQIGFALFASSTRLDSDGLCHGLNFAPDPVLSAECKPFVSAVIVRAVLTDTKRDCLVYGRMNAPPAVGVIDVLEMGAGGHETVADTSSGFEAFSPARKP